MRNWISVSQVVLLLLVAACAESQTDDGAERGEEEGAGSTRGETALRIHSIPEVSEVGVMEESSGPISRDPGMEKLVSQARQDLAARLAIGPDDIELLEAGHVTWRDSSAGCPQPGMQYLQVLTNGTRIRLRAENKTYHYHSGGDRPPFFCANPSPIDPLPFGDA